MNTEYYMKSQRDYIDKKYGEQYDHLFPDIEPDDPTSSILDDVGDSYIQSEDFIRFTLEAYVDIVNYKIGLNDRYTPPTIMEVYDEIYPQYDAIMSNIMATQYEVMKDGKDLDDDTDSDLSDMIAEMVLEEFAATAGVMAEEKICRVLDHFGYAYIDEDFIYNENTKTSITYKKIFNSSQQTLFDMTFTNSWSEGGAYDNDENIERGYSNLLRTSMERLW